MKITTVGLDLAKNVFQLHGIVSSGSVVLRKRPQVLTFFTDLPSCIVGLEACSSAHFWAREFIALGHDVRIIPPSYGSEDVTVLLCGSSRTHLGTSMPSGGGHIIRALARRHR